MDDDRRLVNLVSMIKDGVLKIDGYLASQGRPSPSNSMNDPPSLGLPSELAPVQVGILEAIDELKCLIMGPIEHIANTGADLTMETLFSALHRFQFAHAFDLGTTITFNEVASKVGLEEDNTRRLLRLAISHRIFTEPSKGTIAHTALSRALRETPHITPFLGLITEEAWRAQARMVEAMIKWPGSEEPSETGYNLTCNLPGVPYFEGIKNDPMRVRRFEDSMKFSLEGSGYERESMFDAYDWNSCRSIVDVGGGAGDMCIGLAQQFGHLNSVNQDQADVIAMAKVPADLKDRVTMLVHDFFETQPVVGADVYLFRRLLHDWGDAHCVRILRALIPALRKGSRILVNDVCLPEPGTVPLIIERRMRNIDLAMKATLNGKERDEQEWRNLFQLADPRFQFSSVKVMGRAAVLMEVKWLGEETG